MDKTSIQLLLEEKHQALFKWLEQQPIENWESGPEGKIAPAKFVPCGSPSRAANHQVEHIRSLGSSRRDTDKKRVALYLEPA